MDSAVESPSTTVDQFTRSSCSSPLLSVGSEPASLMSMPAVRPSRSTWSYAHIFPLVVVTLISSMSIVAPLVVDRTA